MGIRYAVNEKFFDTWSSEMAYALGYIVADGNITSSLKNRSRYVKITSADYERLVFFKRLFKSAHIIRTQVSTGKTVYYLRIGNAYLFDSLQRRGIKIRKSLTVNLPIVPKKLRGHFLRGYFDGDGCVYIERAMGKRNRCIDKAVRTIFTSGSKRFLKQLNDQLNSELHIKRRVLKTRRSFQIRYNTQDSIQLFVYMYRGTAVGTYMPRKYDSFRKYFERRKDQVSKEVQSVLECMDGLMVKR